MFWSGEGDRRPNHYLGCLERPQRSEGRIESSRWPRCPWRCWRSTSWKPSLDPVRVRVQRIDFFLVEHTNTDELIRVWPCYKRCGTNLARSAKFSRLLSRYLFSRIFYRQSVYLRREFVAGELAPAQIAIWTKMENCNSMVFLQTALGCFQTYREWLLVPSTSIRKQLDTIFDRRSLTVSGSSRSSLVLSVFCRKM